MPVESLTRIPKDAILYEGEKGGLYFLRNGKKVYVTKSKPKKPKTFKVRPGAYARYLENQKILG